MKIVFIITGLGTGGAETVLLNLLQRFDRSRIDPQVISLTTKGQIGPRIEALGIPVLALGMSVGSCSSIPKFLQLARYLRRAKPDIVKCDMYHADLLGGLAAKLARVPAVVWGIHHSNLSPKQNKHSTLVTVKICAFLSNWIPNLILTCSKLAEEVHTEVGYCSKKMLIIPNGFDLTYFHPDVLARMSIRAELGLQTNTLLVGLIARYDPQKNHEGFVRAAKLVHEVLPDVHFLLAGTGVEASNYELMENLTKAGLQKYFHLLGRRDDIPRIMSSLDVLASPSLGEAFPNVLGEAMACEVPCVVTDVGDSAEIVGDTGQVVASGDMAALASHIIELLQMPKEQRKLLGARARERIRERYEISHVVRQYDDMYMQLRSGS